MALMTDQMDTMMDSGVSIVSLQQTAISAEALSSSSSSRPTPLRMTELHTTVSVPVSELLKADRSSGAESSGIRRSSLSPPTPTGRSKGKGKERDEPLANGQVEVHEREDGSGTEYEEDDDEGDYEAIRVRQIEENKRLLASLGIHPSSSMNNQASSSSSIPAAAGPTFPSHAATRRRKAPSQVKATVYDRSGHVISLPPEGKTHTMACVEMPSDRKIRKQIADGEYQDCSSWREGESRRWRFGFGRGQLQEGEEETIGGVGSDFRWRRWRGLHRELRSEMKKWDGFVEREKAKTPVQDVPEGISAYSLIPGEACHQCRRKSEKPKMRCRNIDPVCRATFCETCCKRYNYFEFDEDSRSFICPLCRDCCNCSQCIRKRNLVHLLGTTTSEKGFKKQSVKQRMSEAGVMPDGMTVQAWLELTEGKEEKLEAPFDRVRLVDQATDVVSPAIPEEEAADMDVVVVAQPKKRWTKNAGKGKKRTSTDVDGAETEDGAIGNAGRPKGKRGRKKKVVEEEVVAAVDDGESTKRPLVVKLKIPQAAQVTTPTERVKEVDSDGDTVGVWSSDEDGDKQSESGSESALTSLSSASPSLAPPPRFRFPSRQPQPPQLVQLSPPHDGDPPHPIVPAMPTADLDLSEQKQQRFSGPPDLSRVIGLGDEIAQSPTENHPRALVASAQSSPDKATPTLGQSQKRKPPPTANIVRAPRHSSIPTSTTLDATRFSNGINAAAISVALAEVVTLETESTGPVDPAGVTPKELGAVADMVNVNPIPKIRLKVKEPSLVPTLWSDQRQTPQRLPQYLDSTHDHNHNNSTTQASSSWNSYPQFPLQATYQSLLQSRPQLSALPSIIGPLPMPSMSMAMNMNMNMNMNMSLDPLSVPPPMTYWATGQAQPLPPAPHAHWQIHTQGIYEYYPRPPPYSHSPTRPTLGLSPSTVSPMALSPITLGPRHPPASAPSPSPALAPTPVLAPQQQSQQQQQQDALFLPQPYTSLITNHCPSTPLDPTFHSQSKLAHRDMQSQTQAQAQTQTQTQTQSVTRQSKNLDLLSLAAETRRTYPEYPSGYGYNKQN